MQKRNPLKRIRIPIPRPGAKFKDKTKYHRTEEKMKVKKQIEKEIGPLRRAHPERRLPLIG